MPPTPDSYNNSTFGAGLRRHLAGLLRWSWRVLVAVSVAFFLCTVALKFTPLGEWIAVALMAATPLDELPQADAIVVLGGDPLRAADALRIYRAGKAPMIVISGEAKEVSAIFDAGLVPRRDVRFDTAPRRTVDHPRTILAVEGIDRSSRLILVTSKLHQRRALMLFRQAGYEHLWMGSLESELYAARQHQGLSPTEIACVYYELAARVKGWLVD